MIYKPENVTFSPSHNGNYRNGETAVKATWGEHWAHCERFDSFEENKPCAIFCLEDYLKKVGVIVGQPKPGGEK